MPSSVPLNVNGRATAVEVDDPDMPLLYALRNNLGLHGPRFGCGLGQCGSCTVHIDGEAVRSCVTPLSAVAPGQRIVTLEGLGPAAFPERLRESTLASTDEGLVTRPMSLAELSTRLSLVEGGRASYAYPILAER